MDCTIDHMADSADMEMDFMEGKLIFFELCHVLKIFFLKICSYSGLGGGYGGKFKSIELWTLN
jgi:hypothetical protein